MRHLLICLSLAATPAGAEPFFRSGDWLVLRTRSGPAPGCEAGAFAADGHLSLSMDKHGLDLNIRSEAFGAGRGAEKILLWIDSRTIWRLPVRRDGDFLWADLEGPRVKELLSEIVEGRRLYVDVDRDGTSEVDFSLKGSMLAFAEFVRCQMHH